MKYGEMEFMFDFIAQQIKQHKEKEHGGQAAAGGGKLVGCQEIYPDHHGHKDYAGNHGGSHDGAAVHAFRSAQRYFLTRPELGGFGSLHGEGARPGARFVGKAAEPSCGTCLAIVGFANLHHNFSLFRIHADNHGVMVYIVYVFAVFVLVVHR